MAVMKLKAPCKEYLWGGHRLEEEYHKENAGKVVAETWELSCYPDSPSIIANGPYAGRTLPEFIEEKGKAVLGHNCDRFREFPVLIKFIDAKKDLSIQVHPNNEYAYLHEQQPGKTEMWYVMDAEEDARLYYGFSHEISKEEFRRRISENNLTEVLHSVPVQKGDVFFIESGTLHAIGAGILIAEIQQNSNVTYRVYDYGRKDGNGRLRELHIEKALEVTKREAVKKGVSPEPHVAACPYFTVDKLYLDGTRTDLLSGRVGEDSFVHILVLDGEGIISSEDDSILYQKGDSLFLPAGSGSYMIKGRLDGLMTTEQSAE